MVTHRTHLIITCQHCGKILNLPVANPRVGDKPPLTGLDDARRLAEVQGWSHEDDHWTCSTCQATIDVAEEVEETADT